MVNEMLFCWIEGQKGSPLSDGEKEKLNIFLKRYSVSDIEQAAESTVAHTGKFNFSYFAKVLEAQEQRMNESRWYVVIKVLDQAGNWYSNALIENEFDALQVAKFYRDTLGYTVKVMFQGMDMTDFLDKGKFLTVRK